MPKKDGYFRPNAENAWSEFNKQRMNKTWEKSLGEYIPKFRHKAYRKAFHKEFDSRLNEVKTLEYADWESL